MKTMKKMKPMDFTPMEPLKKMKDYEDDFDKELMKVERKSAKFKTPKSSKEKVKTPKGFGLDSVGYGMSASKANAMNKRQEKADRAVLTKGMKK